MASTQTIYPELDHIPWKENWLYKIETPLPMNLTI